MEAHGLIGDLQTAALVAKDGTLDWFCAPRFDSPSLFGGLLDRHKGGHFQVSPEGVDYVSKQLYLPGTPILITRFLSADGVGELVDFMPVAGDQPTDRHRLVRMLRVVRGVMRFRVDCQPRFNYGRDPHELDAYPAGHVFRSPALSLAVSLVRYPETRPGEQAIQVKDGGIWTIATLREGEAGVPFWKQVRHLTSRTSTRRVRSRSCWSKPATSGGDGWAVPVTRDVGGRWSSGRR
ncbi:hypothetical protein GCM10027614_79270 [Micromonospora vulcania]